MSKYEQIKTLNDNEFRRLTDVRKETFAKMWSVYEAALAQIKKIKGRPATLSSSDQLLMMLEYNREYRTYFHIANSYGLSESNAYRCIKRAQELLIHSGAFSLMGCKTLQAADNEFNIVVVDATETKIERPQENNEPIPRPKRNTTISKPK